MDAATAAETAGLHVGNSKSLSNLQVYRSLPEEVIGCIDESEFNGLAAGTNFSFKDAMYQAIDHGGGKPPPPPPPAPTAQRAREMGEVVLNSINLFKTKLNAGAPAPGAGTTQTTGNNTTQKTTAAPTQQSAVRPGQVSSLAGIKSCLKNPIVFKPSPELLQSSASEDGVNIHWRSISSVFKFLGDIVASESDTLISEPVKKVWSWDNKGQRELLFHLAADLRDAKVIASYRGKKVGISASRHDGVIDHSLVVMALLTQLLNDSRVAGDIPTTQRLEVVP